jgi:N-acetyl-alpha-D-muramate 1-phosphate uridylyltransferase
MSISFESKKDGNFPAKSGLKAMIFAAGLGTRFKPWTNQHPKALAKVNGKTLLERNIKWLQAYGIWDVVVNVHHFADQVVQAVMENRGWGSRVEISDETAELLETGGGLKKAAWYFDSGSFVVINVDILTDFDLGQMIKRHKAESPLATLAVSARKSSRYFLFNSENLLSGWRNTSTGSEKIARPEGPLIPMAFSGVQMIDPRIFTLIHKEGKFSMVDLYLDLAKREKITAFNHDGSRFIDVGTSESAKKAADLFP